MSPEPDPDEQLGLGGGKSSGAVEWVERCVRRVSVSTEGGKVRRNEKDGALEISLDSDPHPLLIPPLYGGMEEPLSPVKGER